MPKGRVQPIVTPLENPLSSHFVHHPLLHLVRRLSTVSNGLPWAGLTSVYASQMAGRLRFLGADSALQKMWGNM